MNDQRMPWTGMPGAERRQVHLVVHIEAAATAVLNEYVEIVRASVERMVGTKMLRRDELPDGAHSFAIMYHAPR